MLIKKALGFLWRGLGICFRIKQDFSIGNRANLAFFSDKAGIEKKQGQNVKKGPQNSPQNLS